MTTIQIRIDNKTKDSAKKVLDDIGMDMSSAIKVYLKQIAKHKGIPLHLTTGNGFTPAVEAQISLAAKEARLGKNVTKSMNSKTAIKYLKSI